MRDQEADDQRERVAGRRASRERMNSAHASDSTDVVISVRPRPRRRDQLAEISAPASEPTPPIPIDHAERPLRQPQLAQGRTACTAREEPPEIDHTMCESTIGRTIGCWNTSRTRSADPRRRGAADRRGPASLGGRMLPSRDRRQMYVAASIPPRAARRGSDQIARPPVRDLGDRLGRLELRVASASWRARSGPQVRVVRDLEQRARRATTAPVTSTCQSTARRPPTAIVSDDTAAADQSEHDEDPPLRPRSSTRRDEPTSSPGAICSRHQEAHHHLG